MSTNTINNQEQSFFTTAVKRSRCAIASLASAALAVASAAAIAKPTVGFIGLASVIGVSAVVAANPVSTAFIIGGIVLGSVFTIVAIAFLVILGITFQQPAPSTEEQPASSTEEQSETSTNVFAPSLEEINAMRFDITKEKETEDTCDGGFDGDASPEYDDFVNSGS